MGSHDRLFKELFQAFFRDLLRLTLPWLEERLRGEPPRFLSGELHLPRSRRGRPRADPLRTDLVAEVRSREGRPELVLVHVEIERRRRREMARRLHRYAALLRATHGKPVVPLVVYLTGGREPGVVRETWVEELWGQELARFHYFAFALARNEAAEYLRRPEPLAAALASLMRPGDLTPPRHKLECLRRITQAGDLDDTQRVLLTACIDTYVELDDDEAVQFQRLKEEELPMALPELTIYERMEKKGAQRLLVSLLERRFGRLDDDARGRVEAIRSLEELERLGERVLTAESLEELGLY